MGASLDGLQLDAYAHAPRGGVAENLNGVLLEWGAPVTPRGTDDGDASVGSHASTSAPGTSGASSTTFTPRFGGGGSGGSFEGPGWGVASRRRSDASLAASLASGRAHVRLGAEARLAQHPEERALVDDLVSAKRSE